MHLSRSGTEKYSLAMMAFIMISVQTVTIDVRSLCAVFACNLFLPLQVVRVVFSFKLEGIFGEIGQLGLI